MTNLPFYIFMLNIKWIIINDIPMTKQVCNDMALGVLDINVAIAVVGRQHRSYRLIHWSAHHWYLYRTIDVFKPVRLQFSLILAVVLHTRRLSACAPKESIVYDCFFFIYLFRASTCVSMWSVHLRISYVKG